MRFCAVFRPVFLLCSVAPAWAHLVAPQGQPPPPMADAPPTLMGRTDDGLVMPLPLVSTHVQVDIRGLVASTVVTQVYANRTARPLETTYVFPLPPQATVHHMEATVGGRVIRSVVQEKEQARRTFEAARAQGQRAALLEQQRPNVFTLALTHLMPGDRMDVTLRYVEPLAWDAGRVRLTFPTVVAPRFVPEDAVAGVGCFAGGMTDVDRLQAPVAERHAGHDLEFSVRAAMGTHIPQVSSPTHTLDVMRAQADAVELTLADGMVLPDRDIVVDFELPRSDQPQTALFVSPADDGGHFMLVAYPPVERRDERRAPMDWIFVQDVSGSMEGPSMEQARGALAASFDRMRPGDRFNVVAYNHTYWAHAPAPVEVQPDTVKRARAFVSGLEAAGGTMLLPALTHALSQPRVEGMLRYVVVVTDGDLGNEEQVLAGLRKHLGDARLFVVAVGSAPNHFLAQKMADEGRGTFTTIADGREIAARMAELLNKIEAPALSDIRLTFRGVEVEDVYPLHVPDVFMGAPVTVFGRMKGEGGSMVLTGMRGTQPLKTVVPFDVSQAAEHPGIRTLWARKVADEMVDAYRHSGTEAEREQVQQNLVTHAIGHHLVTQFTSLVAVEDRVVNATGELENVSVPVELPAGWDAAKVLGNPRGGTAETFLQLMAALLMTAGMALQRLGRRSACRA